MMMTETKKRKVFIVEIINYFFMNNDLKKAFEKIGQKGAAEYSHNRFFFPNYKADAFFKALKENIEEIEKLANFLYEKRKDVLDKYNEYFLTISLIFKSFFQISSQFVGDIISNPENNVLFQNFKLFSDNLEISRAHLDKIKGILMEKEEEFTQLILKLEKSYIRILQSDLIEFYRNSNTKFSGNLFASSEEILELVPWHCYFPESIWEWNDNYSPIPMYKLLVWSRLEKIDGCLKIRDAIHKKISSTNKNYILFGQNLGFVGNLPEKTKIYDFFYKLNDNILKQTKEIMARFLIRMNIYTPLILVVDSTSAKGQEDDPAFSKDVKPNSNRKKTHKIHAVCDGNGVPLLNCRTQGEMNDLKGFNKYKNSLLRLKKIADEEGRKVIGVAIDAGFSFKEALQWIDEKLKVPPIPWPRNPREGEMRYLIHWLENLRLRFRFLKKSGANISPDGLLKDEAYVGIIEKIETICEYLCKNGSEYAQFIGTLLLEIGIHEWFTIYRRRGTIEGMIGIIKAYYNLLKRTRSQSLPVTGAENIEKHSSLVIIAMQINAFFRYLMLRKETGILKPSLVFKISELELQL